MRCSGENKQALGSACVGGTEFPASVLTACLYTLLFEGGIYGRGDELCRHSYITQMMKPELG